jgi:6,7-dimethyl-8-ribityllumazine synthase
MRAPLRVLIVEGRFYSELSDALLKGATDALEAFGAEVEVVTMPGALEIPPAIAMAAEWGDFDGYVALGCVIRGETHHFEIVADQSARALMDLGVRKRVAVGNGILTVEDEAQAWVRADSAQGDKGGAAAKACLDLIAFRRRLKDERA